ncbi:hypothetical protein [Chroococcus sp. FPU101]|uniref:hypothetical protein n=1 Tax=Chroococcus sp. FPU101 TaxID=1974212 RepID=UPI001A9098A3|nr:hypothetical protein [Chroococcus sp. FPU101]GFE69443.1 unknown protein [Chroococcus sp. FPU101]
MNIGEILLPLLIGGGVGGGVSYFLQKGRISEVAQRYDQKYSQTRQDLENAEAELKEKKAQLLALSQSEARAKSDEAQAKSELQNLEVSYRSHLEQIERSYQEQLEDIQRPLNVSPKLEAELEQAKAQLLDYQDEIKAYQTQILELEKAVTPSAEPEPEQIPIRIQEIEQHHQAYIEELQQTYSTQLQEIESAHQAELAEQQQTYYIQFQEIEQAYQNQIVELEKTHQHQIRELEQAYQSQMLELQQAEAEYDSSVSRMSQSPDEMRLPAQFTEPWDEDFSKNTLLDTSFTEAQEENIAKISSLEELADLTSQLSDEPEEVAMDARQQAEFLASQTLIGDIDFLDSMHSEEVNDDEAEMMDARQQAEFLASQTLIGDIDFLDSMHLEEVNDDEVEMMDARQQAEFLASQTLIGDIDFLDSMQLETESTSQTEENEPANLVLEDLYKVEGEFSHSQTLVDEMDFLESFKIDAHNNEFELGDLTNISEDFFVSNDFTHEENSDLVLSAEEIKEDKQSLDLDIFDLFDSSKDEELNLDAEMSHNGYTNGSNGHFKSEFETYQPDADLDFFKMLDENHSESTESLELDAQVNLEDLFSEDLFHSEKESSPKN